jgi:transposase
MTLRPQSLLPVPEATAAALYVAFPRGNLSVELRAELGTLYDDQLFADLYPPSGRPVEVAPWRLALVVVMQYIEGLTDRQAADAVRRCMDWQYAFSLELTDPGFDFTLLHDFRQRILAHAAGQQFLDAFLASCKARGWIKARGMQRTDSTHVLAAIRTLHRMECVLEAMHDALNQLSNMAPAWVQQHVPLDWYPRYGLRSDQARLPKDATTRASLACQIGADGYRLLEWVHLPESPPNLCDLPALEALRRIWVQQYYRCTAPGHEALRWRAGDEQPPSAVRIASPYDLEARYSSKRETHWVGYKVHLTETCDADHPDLITPVMTTPATTQDSIMGPAIQQDLADRNLLPGTHVLDSGYVDADLLVTAQTPHQIDVVGPPFGSYSRQWREGKGDDLQAFAIDWEAQQARCPQGHSSVHWRPGHDVSGDPVMRIRFDRATCRACPARPACTSAQTAPPQLTVRLQAHHEALQAARQRQGTPPFKTQYALRAEVESSLSQGIRRFDRRRSRYIGLARTHLQQLLNTTAMNVVRVIAWLWDEALRERTRKPGPLARLAPHPLSRQTVFCEGMT